MLQRAKKFTPTSPFLKSLHESVVDSGDTHVEIPGRVENALYRMTKTIIEHPEGNIDAVVREQWRVCKTLMPEQLLSILKTALVADELPFSFNYHGLFVACATFLESTMQHVEPRVTELRRCEGLGEGFFVFEMVDEVLWQAARTQRSSPRYLRANTLLGEVATVLQPYIHKAGSQWFDRARQVVDAQLCNTGGRMVTDKKWSRVTDDMSVTLEGGRLEMVPRCLSEREEKARAAAKAEMVRARGEGRNQELELSFLSSLAGGSFR
ncbi:hypothetical protein LTR36_010108 [Oleoguttula mirabilis]|uniref:Uncharacterized protein n=1 Tax=Oleoguttula mirabilis TaxID=1507867 RepID=A0AAV9JRJ5_9PEZI|nr:hypothetical protein LTR36_010108 [Oleoguttula mirabilis]